MLAISASALMIWPLQVKLGSAQNLPSNGMLGLHAILLIWQAGGAVVTL